MKTKQFILVLLALFASVTAKAADNDVFTASSLEGVDMFFTIISEEDKTVQVGKYVVAANNYFPAIDDSYEGSITIPSKVTNNEKEYTVVRLGARAFHNCKKLTEVTLPNTINSESPYSAAFGNCESLTKVTIPEGVTVIGWQDYWGCTSLATISIPSTVTSIGSEAFYNTKWLNDQPDGLVYISNFLYTYKGEMPANTHINVAEGTTTILGKAFYNCTNLTSITLPSTLTTIDNNSLTGFAFDGCTNLASVTLHTPTVSSWFKAMTSITTVVLGEEIESIASDAFDGCNSLTSVTMKRQTPVSITATTFSNAANATLWVPNSSLQAYQAAPNYNLFKDIKPFIEFEDPVVKEICVSTSLTWDSNRDGELSFEEAAAVKNIGSNFSDSRITSLNDLEYFTGVEYLSTYNLSKNIRSIAIPSNVIQITGTSDYAQDVSFPRLTDIKYCDGTKTLWYAQRYIWFFPSESHPNVKTLYIGRNLDTMYDTKNQFYAGIITGSTVNVIDLIIGPNVTTVPPKNLLAAPLSGITVSGKIATRSIDIADLNNWMGIASTIKTFRGGSVILKYQGQVMTNIDIPSGVTTIPSYSFYDLSNENLTITIPNTVTSIGEWAFGYCSDLTSVTIPNNVKRIGNYAFYECSDLTSVTIGNSVTSIGTSAFQNCSGLASVTIPNSVTTINANAFDIPKMENIIIPASVTSIGSNGVTSQYVTFQSSSPIAHFDAPSSTVFIVPSDAVEAYKTAWPNEMNRIFGSMDDLREYTVSVSAKSNSSALVDAIGDENMLNVVKLKVSGTINSYDMMVMHTKMVNLKELDLADASIVACDYNGGAGTSKDNVFSNFLAKPNLRALVLPNTITQIANNALSGYSCLESITIPASVTQIGNSAFANCSSLKSIVFEESENELSIGTSAFSSTPITTIAFNRPALSSIGASAFRNCTRLTSISTPNTTIGDYAFSGCRRLSSFVYGGDNGVRAIGDYAFQNCGSLSSFVCGDDIGVGAFKGSGITTITLQEGVTSIGNEAFSGCNIRSVSIPASVTTIGDKAFAKSYIESIVIGSGVTSFGSEVFTGCVALESATIDSQIIGTSLFSGCSNLKTVNILGHVETINSQAFYSCSNLQSIQIAEGVKTIDQYVFAGCTSLTSLTLPTSVTSLGANNFNGCNNLTRIEMGRGVTTIIENTFNNCSNLSEVKLSPSTSVIQSNAFSNCPEIREIRLPSTLTSIGNGAFSGCSNLRTIYAYMPDIITIGTSTFPNSATSTLYVPDFLYNAYYYDTNWCQFLHVYRCDLRPGDYETFYSNGDILFADGEERITSDTPIATIGSQGSITVEGEAQAFDTVDQTVDANYSASLIGDGEGVANNMPMNELRVNIAVTAGKWYFFCFPFDVTIASCTYPGRYAWRSYDGATRAANGSGGWQKVTAETLNAREGYAFQSETTGTLTVRFSAPTFGGNRTCELEVHSASNAQNASWNFVGNPYSSYYDFGTSDITSPITVWTGSSYTAYRPGDDELHLRPYQAFFVQKPEAASSIQFNAERRESYRQSQHTAASRALAPRTENVKSDRIFLDIAISDNDTATLDRTRLVLNEKAQRSYELDCDAAKFMADDAAAQIYMMEDGQPMAINERPVKGDIRLGYIAKNKGTLSIKAQRMDLPMLLIDIVTGTEFDLSNGDYEFSTEAGTFNNRFMLRLSGEATAIRNLANETGVTISKTKGGLNIASAEGKTVEVYNVGGSLVSCQNNGFISLPTGIYLVKVNGKSTKISVK